MYILAMWHIFSLLSTVSLASLRFSLCWCIYQLKHVFKIHKHDKTFNFFHQVRASNLFKINTLLKYNLIGMDVFFLQDDFHNNTRLTFIKTLTYPGGWYSPHRHVCFGYFWSEILFPEVLNLFSNCKLLLIFNIL